MWRSSVCTVCVAKAEASACTRQVGWSLSYTGGWGLSYTGPQPLTHRATDSSA